VDVSPLARSLLGSAALGDASILADRFSLPESTPEQTGLDPRTAGLIRLAALAAMDAPPAAFANHVARAREDGVSADEIVGVLRTIAPLIGASKVIAAAPEMLLALGLSLPEDVE
jgi:alkylhydroperoxidase/carboxymuconolactone decarboxylase family protein YurZ